MLMQKFLLTIHMAVSTTTILCQNGPLAVFQVMLRTIFVH
jgi:hypothetical protein